MAKGEQAGGGGEKEVKSRVEAKVAEGTKCITSGGHTDLRRAARVDGNTAASVSDRRDWTEDYHSIASDGQTEKSVFIHFTHFSHKYFFFFSKKI